MEGQELENTIVYIGLIPVIIVAIIVAVGVLKEQVLYNFYNWVYVVFGISIGKYFTFGVYKLTDEQEDLLHKRIRFYRVLNPLERTQFNHRVKKFIKNKEFIGKGDVEVNEDMKLFLAASAVMLSFGFGKYELYGFTKIFIYQREYYSTITKQYHKGEMNPKGVIVVSWQHFEAGIENDTDNINLGIHEFAHAYLQEAKAASADEPDDFGEPSMVHNLLAFTDMFANPKYKERLQEVEALRDYAYTNLDEFFAVTCEYFFETPKQLKQNAPLLYDTLSNMLNQDTAKLLR